MNKTIKTLAVALTVLSLMALASCSNVVSDLPTEDSCRVASTGGGMDNSLCLVGDSRVYLWPKSYFTDWDVTNIAVGGTTSIYSAYAIAYQTKHFDVMIISVGINDYMKDVTLQDSIISLTSCIKWAKVRADHVFITTIPGTQPSVNFTASESFCLSYRAAQLNNFIPTLATNNGAICIPLANTMNIGWNLKPEYDDGSGIHYNAHGYEDIYALYTAELNKPEYQ